MEDIDASFCGMDIDIDFRRIDINAEADEWLYAAWQDTGVDIVNYALETTMFDKAIVDEQEKTCGRD